jgi:hypothetical protein
MKYVAEVDKFLETVCTVDQTLLHSKLEDVLLSRRQFEKDLMGNLMDPFMCIDFGKKVSSLLSLLGSSGKEGLPYTEDKIKKFLRYPTFSENAERLKLGRFSRNSDPRKFLHKQYPIVEGGPAGIMGDVTADKWERIFATCKLLMGSGFLSNYKSFLYAGVTNSDRMLGGICNAWSSEGPTKKLDGLVLLDKNAPNPSKWNLKHGDHVFSMRTSQNPAGEFVQSDLIPYMDALDSTGEKSVFMFSDANVLSTNDEDFFDKGEFSSEGIDLGYEKLTAWIVNLKGATPNGTAAAKYIFKCASKFKGGVLKLHLFKVDPSFMISVQQKLHDLCGFDSLLWKEGRGHNPEYFFYFFPPVEGRLVCRSAAWVIPTLCLCSAASEITRHIAFYCPNKIEGKPIGPEGILSHSSSFPVIFPSSNVREYEKFEIGGKVYLAIKNIRVGTQTLVAGIANSTEEIIDLDRFKVAKPPAPKEETTKFAMEAPSTEVRKIVPVSQLAKSPPPAEEVEEENFIELNFNGRKKPVVVDTTTSDQVVVEDISPEDADEIKRKKRLDSAFDF